MHDLVRHPSTARFIATKLVRHFVADDPGGQVTGAWPGQTAFHENRAIRPTTDYESLFKTVLIGRFGVSPAVVEDKVFPHNRDLPPTENLFRTV